MPRKKRSHLGAREIRGDVAFGNGRGRGGRWGESEGEEAFCGGSEGGGVAFGAREREGEGEGDTRLTSLPSRFQNTHFSLMLPKSANPDSRRVGRTANVFDVQQLVLVAESKEVGEERVEVRFGVQVEDLRVVRMVYMHEYA